MGEWTQKQRQAFAVLVPEFVGAPIATLGAVYGMEKIPKQMDWLSGIVAKHVVAPHLESFEYVAKGLRKAHQDYDERKRAYQLAHGKEVTLPQTETRKERAFAISDGIVKTLIAIGADFAATYQLQKVFNKALNAGIEPAKTAMFETSVHLGLIAMMPTAFPKLSENLHYGIAKRMQRHMGTSREHADERARALTYVSAPGYLASIASLFYAQKSLSPTKQR